MTAPTDRRAVPRRSLAVAVGAAPTAWLAHLLVSYALVPVACRGGAYLLHLTTFVAAAGALAGGVVAYRCRRHAQDGGADAFLALAGLAMSPLFLLVILVAGIGNILVGACAG